MVGAVPAEPGWFAVVAWPLLGEEDGRAEVGKYPVLAWIVAEGPDEEDDALVYDPGVASPGLVRVRAMVAAAGGRLLRYEHDRWARRPPPAG